MICFFIFQSKISFLYDALGNRVAKEIYYSGGPWKQSEYYIRDAQGNIMAMYKHNTQNRRNVFAITQRPIYGSNRIGVDLFQGKTSLLFFLFGLLTPFILHAQIKGSIADSLNNPVSFTNVFIVNAKDTSLIKGSMADEKGEFIIEMPDTGNYRLMAYMVGYKKYISPMFYIEQGMSNKNFGVIILKSSISMLGQVEVVAQRPLIEHRMDMTVLNVENSILSAGNSALEILKRAPAVSVDKDGRINLKGKAGVSIWINGKPSYLSQEDVSKMLSSMSSDQIEKVEIISNPSAKYDAAGNAGIINIVLKKNKTLGLNAQVTAGYGQGVYDKENAGINMNYRTPKWNVFGSYNYNRNKNFYRFDIKRNYLTTNHTLTSSVNQLAENSFTEKTNTAKAGIDFTSNERHSFGVFLNGVFSPQRIKYNTNTVINDYVQPASSNVHSLGSANTDWINTGANINYNYKIDTTGKTLSANADYLVYNSAMRQLYDINYWDVNKNANAQTILKSHLPSDIDIASIKVDYSQPISSKSKVDVGLKSSLVSSDNNAMYWNVINGIEFSDSTKSNHFNYRENINAAYVNYSNTVSEKFSFQIGLRSEQTLAKGIQYTSDTSFSRDYFRLFPSGLLHWKANDRNEINLTYSRRIDRPGYQDLNPFLFFLDPFTYMQGNPLLNPQYTNSIELSHSFHSKFNTALYYSNTNKPMLQVAKQEPNTKAMYYVFLNMSSLINYGASLSYRTDITKWWSNSTYVGSYYNIYTGSIQGENVSNGKITVNVNIQNSFLLGSGFKGELSWFYISKQVYGVFVFKPVQSLSIGVQKLFAKENGTIKLSVSDLLWTERGRGSVVNSFSTANIYNYHDTRVVNLTLSYRLGKSTTEYRARTNQATDEMNRVKDKKE